MMLESVVTGVIDAAGMTLLGETDVQHGDAQMIEENRKIGARAQRLNREVLARVRRDPGLGLEVFRSGGCQRRYANSCAQALSDRNSGLGIYYFAGDFVNQVLKVVAASDLQEASFVGIGVYVEDLFLL